MIAINESRSANPHPTDGELLAFHDGEPVEDTATTARHLETCQTCRARLERIAASARVVHAELAKHAAAVPRFEPPAHVQEFRRASSWRRRVSPGAIAALLAAGAMVAAASPLRHWFEARQGAQPAANTSPRDSTPTTTKLRPPTRISFALAGDELTIRLDSLPSSGYLTIERATGDRVSLAPDEASGSVDSMAVLPNEIRLYGKPGASLQYILTIPQRVTRLRVMVQGATTFNGPPLGRVPLAGIR